jgi:FAD synthase|tara:strand:+ start:17115 stop:17444 length:330 start_codon:yes stop_codon:yes gene_type:complete
MNLSGEVIVGGGKSRAWKVIPTANILQNLDNPLEAGAYFAKCYMGDNFLGFCLVMVYDSNLRVVEAYIEDFNKNIYGKEISLIDIKRISLEDNKKAHDVGINFLKQKYV